MKLHLLNAVSHIALKRFMPHDDSLGLTDQQRFERLLMQAVVAK